MKKKPPLIPVPNFFAETLRETLEESSLSEAEIARRCGIPAPHLTQMKQGKRRCTPEYDLRLSAFFGITPRHVDESPTRLRIHARGPGNRRSDPQGNAAMRCLRLELLKCET